MFKWIEKTLPAFTPCCGTSTELVSLKPIIIDFKAAIEKVEKVEKDV